MASWGFPRFELTSIDHELDGAHRQAELASHFSRGAVVAYRGGFNLLWGHATIFAECSAVSSVPLKRHFC